MTVCTGGEKQWSEGVHSLNWLLISFFFFFFFPVLRLYATLGVMTDLDIFFTYKLQPGICPLFSFHVSFVLPL